MRKVPDYNKECRIIYIDLGTDRGSYLHDISKFYGIRRFPHHNNRTKVLLAHQTTLYRLSLHGSRGYKNCILQYYMKNDDLYSIALSKSEDSGRTFSTAMEIPDRETGKMIIAGSKSIGFDFVYDRNWDDYDGLNYDMVVKAFKKVLSVIDVVPLLDASEVKEFSFSAALLLMFISEPMRNTIVAHVCNKVLNESYVVKSMRDELVEKHFWKWDRYSNLSRFCIEGQVLSNEARLHLETHGIKSVTMCELKSEVFIVCHTIITMKCLKSKDFTSDGRVKFIHLKPKKESTNKVTKKPKKDGRKNKPQNKNGLRKLPMMIGKVQGFKLKAKNQPQKYSQNIIDAGMFMGISFSVSWGPNNHLLKCGYTVSNTDQKLELSSLITIEEVAMDNVVRDENNKITVAHYPGSVFFNNSFEALEHYLGCAFWQKAHSTFVTSVAHSLFLSGKDSEISSFATSMEDHKSEIENWDFGAGIYLLFYSLRSSLKGEDDTMTERVSVKDKHEVCKKFFGYLKGSLEIWNNRLPIDARRVYVIMEKKIIDLLEGVCNDGRGDQ